MYGKDILLYYLKIAGTIKLGTSISNIGISTSLDFAAHLQKDVPSSPVMPETF
jgi:hypothetical protein